MIKKIQAILVALMILSIMPLATFANENETQTPSEDISEKELKSFASTLGALIRIEHLKEAITIQFESTKKILEEIKNENVTKVDIEKLETIINEFGIIQEELNSLDLENKTTPEIMESYVEYKTRAVELSKQFKEETQIIDKEKREQLRENYKEKRKELKEIHKKKFEEKRKEFTKTRTKKSLENLDLLTEEIKTKIESGEFKKEEARELIKEKLNSMTDEEKKELHSKFQEEKQKYLIEIKERKEEFKDKQKEFREKTKERVENYKNYPERKNKKSLNEISIKVDMTEEEKQKIREELRKKYDELPEEVKERIKERFENGAKKEILDLNPEEIEKMKQRISDELKEKIDSMTDEEKKEFAKKIEENFKKNKGENKNE